MKLISNTVDEAKETSELYIDESFESDTIFSCNMKDSEKERLTATIINGSEDSSLKKSSKLLNGVVEPVTNGFGTLNNWNGDTNSPASDLEDISDDEVKLVLSEEEDNVLNEKDGDNSRPIEKPLGSKKDILNAQADDVSEVVNGCFDTTSGKCNLCFSLFLCTVLLLEILLDRLKIFCILFT